MLCGDQDGVYTLGNHSSIDLLVFDSDLCLAVWPQPANCTILPDLSQFVPNLSRKHMCEGHQLFSLISGVAKHVALVTGAWSKNQHTQNPSTGHKLVLGFCATQLSRSAKQARCV